MTSFLSIIMVIVMAFTSIGGMTAAMEEPSFFELKVGADVQTLMTLTGSATASDDESAQPTVKLIEDILNVLTLKGVTDKESTELSLHAGEDLLLSFGVKTAEDGATFASSLLGSQVLFFSSEQVQQLQEQMMSSMTQTASTAGGVDIQALAEQFQKMDWEQISKDATEAFTPLTTAITEKMGEPVPGEYEVDGLAFTVKTPLNITYDELMELMLTGVKDLLGKESVQPLVQMFSQGSDPAASVTETLENLKNQPEEEKPVLEIATYASENGSAYLVADMAQKAGDETGAQSQSIHLGVGTADGQTKVLVTSEGFLFDLTAAQAADGNFTLQATLNGTGVDVKADATILPDGGSDVTVDMTLSGMPLRLHIVTAAAEGLTNVQADVFMMNMEKALISLNIVSGKGGEKTSVYEGDSITVIPFEKMSDPEDTTTSMQIQTMMSMRLMGMLSTLTKALPDDSKAVLEALTKQMMTPDSVTKTE